MKRTILILMVFGVWAAGCDSEDGKTYDVEVGWNIAGETVCSSFLSNGDQIDFTDVQIDVYEEEGDEATIQTGTVPCDDFSFTIPRLKRGSYFVKIGAIADYDGDTLPYYQSKGEISAPADDDARYDFSLSRGKSNITVAWDFTQGGCTINGVETVDIHMYGGNDPIEIEDVACSDELYELTDIPWITGGGYTLEIEGFDENGDKVVEGEYEENPFELKPNDYEDPFWVILE